MKNKQKGYASIVSLIIVAGAVGLFAREFGAGLAKKQIQDNSQSFYNRIMYLQTQFKAYATDQYTSGSGINTQFIFPMKLSDLEGDYIPLCSKEDNEKGYCFKYNQTPWGEMTEYDYRLVPLPSVVNPTHWRAELDIELPPKNDEALKYERETTLQMFAKMSNIIIDDEKDKITLIIDRPDKAFGYESLVKRSGDDSTLLGDWDVGGNNSITNVKDITIRNSNGTQRLVSTGLVDIFQVESGTTIYKPSCPQGLVPKLTLNVSATDIDSQYTNTGSARPYIEHETSSSWTVKLEIKAVNNRTGNPEIITKGDMSAFIQCVQNK